MTHSRRTFTAASAAALAAPLWAKEVPPLRAVVIGVTGRGDYGHGMERLFAHRADVAVTAIADPNQTGLAKSLASARARISSPSAGLVTNGFSSSKWAPAFSASFAMA